MRRIDEIIVHCSATRSGWREEQSTAEKVAEIKRWHVEENGWSDIGYHAIIDRDGTVADGRDFGTAGAHCRGRNKHSLGVCLIGGHGSNENDAFEDHYTPEQNRALRRWIELRQLETPGLTVSGHNEHAAKACPGFNVGRWLKNKPAKRTSVAQSKTAQSTAAAAAGTAVSAVTAVSQLDGTAQYLVIGATAVVALAIIVVFRERLRKWAAGDR